MWMHKGLIGLFTLSSLFTKLAAQESHSCKVEYIKIIDPIDSVTYFTETLKQFYKTSRGQQFIYIFMPNDDFPGTLIHCIIQQDSSKIQIRKNGNLQSLKIENKLLLPFFQKMENGGHIQICSTSRTNTTFLLCMVKHDSQITFQYQGINSNMTLIKNELNGAYLLFRHLESFSNK